MSAEAFRPITKRQQDRLEKLFNKRASKVEVKDAHWINGADSGEDYCYDCCKNEVAQLRKDDPKKAEEYSVDGGWRSEHDGPPFCYKCHCRLDGSLTSYGARSELDHFAENGVDLSSDSDCYDMAEVVNSMGWRPYSLRIYEHEYQRRDDERFYRALHDLARKIVGTLKRNQPPSPTR